MITVRDTDKAGDRRDRQADSRSLGFTLYATTRHRQGAAQGRALRSMVVEKIHENPTQNPSTLLESGKIQYVISTSTKGRIPTRDSVKIRRKAVERDIPCLTGDGYGQRPCGLPEEPLFPGQAPSWWTSTICAAQSRDAAICQNAGLRQRLYLFQLLSPDHRATPRG